MGETLASLVMAQRAMSVMMGARINVVPDLDARCQDLQKQLDDQNDKLTQITLVKAATEERLETAQDQIAQLHEEKRAMHARLQAMADAFDRLLEVKKSFSRLRRKSCQRRLQHENSLGMSVLRRLALKVSSSMMNTPDIFSCIDPGMLSRIAPAMMPPLLQCIKIGRRRTSLIGECATGQQMHCVR